MSNFHKPFIIILLCREIQKNIKFSRGIETGFFQSNFLKPYLLCSCVAKAKHMSNSAVYLDAQEIRIKVARTVIVKCSNVNVKRLKTV